jgi:hypothetical protein
LLKSIGSVLVSLMGMNLQLMGQAQRFTCTDPMRTGYLLELSRHSALTRAVAMPEWKYDVEFLVPRSGKFECEGRSNKAMNLTVACGARRLLPIR